MKLNFTLAVLFGFQFAVAAETEGLNINAMPKTLAPPTKTKLVVGIVVDQMRYDYLTRYDSRFGEGGFKRMIQEGFNFKNNYFDYVPTYTAPGHASVYTGTTPKYHGIISNDWYDRTTGEMIYCVDDDNCNALGTKSKDGQKSPSRMMVTSFADQNRLHTQFRGKTIGIAIKDRGAILPAGHTASGAYWFIGGAEGNWVTSDFYMDQLPSWVVSFNNERHPDDYLTVWDTAEDISTYLQSGPDLNPFEGGFKGKATPTFPYDLKNLSSQNKGYDILKTTPFGNSLTTDFAIAAILGESLGADEVTDVLTVSYSSTDYIGHNFGVNAVETEDTYIRLDRDLERLFTFLDERVGQGSYTVFLTADHGAVQVPNYLKSVKIPAGYIDMDLMKTALTEYMVSEYGQGNWIDNISNFQVFLNRKLISERNLELTSVQENLANFAQNLPQVFETYTANDMTTSYFEEGLAHKLQKGFSESRSGDVIIALNPSHIAKYSETGTTHGSGFQYDTHVPLLFFGAGIAHGSTFEPSLIEDIAPTITSMLGVAQPNGVSGQVLVKALGN